METSADIHTTLDLFDRFRLVNRKPLHQPDELLTGQVSDRLLILRPVESAILQTLVQQQESITLPEQNFETVSASAAEQKCTIGEQIQLELLLDN